MSTIEEHRYYRTNLENTALRDKNRILRSVLKDIASTSQNQYIRDLAIETLEKTREGVIT